MVMDASSTGYETGDRARLLSPVYRVSSGQICRVSRRNLGISYVNDTVFIMILITRTKMMIQVIMN